ncbi:hypothetical protein HK102_007481 [Quaeritorhiza haematococci]|nr:hypothetical protein HK102_007481 [Quaeritorhiza haematococci]
MAGDPEGAWRLFSRCVEDVSEFGGQSSPASVEEGRHPPMVIYELVIASIMSPKHLSASASTRSLQRAYRAIEDMSKRGMKPSLKICTSMAAGLSKLHQVDEALGWAERTLSIESFANVDVDNQNGGSAFTIQQESVGVLSREDTIILSALMGPLLKKRRSSPHHLQTVQTFFEAVTRTKEGGDAGVRDQEDRSPTVFENFEQNVDLFISRMIAVLPIDAVLLSMILDFYVRQGKISKAEQILRVAIAAEDHLINKCLHDLFPLKSAHDKRNRSTFPRDTRTDSRRDVVVLPRLLDASCYGSLAVGYLMLDRTDLVRSLVDLMLERGVEPDQYFASKWLKSMVESADFEAVREWWNVTAVNRLRGSAGRTMSPNPKASSTSISKHRGRAPSKLFREGTGSTAARDRRAVDIMDVTDQAQEVCFPKDLSSVRDPVVMSMVLNTFRRHLQRCGQLWQLTAGARNSPGPPSEKEDATSVRAFVDFEQELRRMLEDERARRLLFDRRVIVELLKLYSRNLPMVEHLWTQYTETMSTSEGDPVIITDLVGTNDTTGSQGGQVEGHTIANDNPFRQPPPAHQDARVYTALLVPYVMELRNIQRAQSAPSREVADHGDGCTSDDFDSYREHLVSRVNVILREMGEKSIELHVKMRKRLGQVGIDV